MSDTSPIHVAAREQAPALRNRDKEMIPTVLLRAMFMLALTSLLLVSYAVLTDRPLVGQPPEAPILEEYSVVMLGDRRGTVTITTPDGAVIADMSETEAGFVSVVMRALTRVRMQTGVEAALPIRIVTRENGRITLYDDASDWNMELGHFGDLGKSRFAALLDGLPVTARPGG
jgi:putative photosynthetic complex assembly protein